MTYRTLMARYLQQNYTDQYIVTRRKDHSNRDKTVEGQVRIPVAHQHGFQIKYYTLRELIFAGTNFRDFAVLGQKRGIKFTFFTPGTVEPRKLIPAKFC